MTLKRLIEILREDFSCTFREEKLIYIINMLEKKLYKKGVTSSFKTFYQQNTETQTLTLPEENAEVYIFHILSREAFEQNDIERFNNLSTLYSEALAFVLETQKTSGCAYKNVW